MPSRLLKCHLKVPSTSCCLVNFYAGKDSAYEDVGGIEANSACQAEEGIGDNEHVAEVHDHGHHFGDVQLRVEVEQRVQEQVGC